MLTFHLRLLRFALHVAYTLVICYVHVAIYLHGYVYLVTLRGYDVGLPTLPWWLSLRTLHAFTTVPLGATVPRSLRRLQFHGYIPFTDLHGFAVPPTFVVVPTRSDVRYTTLYTIHLRSHRYDSTIPSHVRLPFHGYLVPHHHTFDLRLHCAALLRYVAFTVTLHTTR